MPTIRCIRDPPVACLPIIPLRHFLLQLIYPIVHSAVNIEKSAFVFQKCNRPVSLCFLKNTEVQEVLRNGLLTLRKLVDLQHPIYRAILLLLQ